MDVVEWDGMDADFLMYADGGGDCLGAIADENDVDYALDLFGAWASKKVSKAKEKVQKYRGAQFKEEVRTEKFSYFVRKQGGVQRVSKCLTYNVKFKLNEETGLPEEIDKTLTPDQQEQKLLNDGWEMVGEELVNETVEEEKEVVTNTDWDIASRSACKALEYGSEVTYDAVSTAGVSVVSKVGVVNTAMAPYMAWLSKTTAPWAAKVLVRLDPYFTILRFASARGMVYLQNKGAQFGNLASFYLGPFAARLNSTLAPYMASASYAVAVRMAWFNAKLTPITVRISASTGLAVTKLCAWSAPLRCQVYAAAAPLYLGAQAVYKPFVEQYEQSFAPLMDGMTSAFAPMVASASTCWAPLKANFKAMVYPIIYPHRPLSNLGLQIWVAMMPLYAAAENTIYPLRQSMSSAISPVYASMRAYVEPVRCAAACTVGPAWANLKTHWEPVYERVCASAFPILVQANTVIVPPVARATNYVMPRVVTMATSTACATAIVHEKTQGIVGACGRGLTNAGIVANSAVSSSCVADVVVGASTYGINAINAKTAETLAEKTGDTVVAMADKQAKLMEAWEAQDAKVIKAAPGAGQLAVRAAERGEEIAVTAARVILKRMMQRKQHIKHFKKGEETLSLEVTEETVTQEVAAVNVGPSEHRLMNTTSNAEPVAAITNDDGLDVRPHTGPVPKDEKTQNFMESRRRKLKTGQHGSKVAAKGAAAKSPERITPETKAPSDMSPSPVKETIYGPNGEVIEMDHSEPVTPTKQDFDAELLSAPMPPQVQAETPIKEEQVAQEAPLDEPKKAFIEEVKQAPSPAKTQVTVDMLDDFWECA
jgi:hypothetical protein